ncbi:MAG: 23S rRNA (uracil(1939)-C(5))-methyltransferase RlmD [Lachnospiraceae bacterium]|nr:23S rRNA (uracil(1939)-C(5))-methyltransferase RlmD [Lachnospiraceae bacterium]
MSEKTVKSPHKCPEFRRCGGCRFLEGSYEDSLRKKDEFLRALLGKFGEPKPIAGMADPFHYRNKVHHVLTRRKDGTVLSGFYEENSRRVVPAEHCLLEDEGAQAIIRTLERLIRSFHYTVYEEERKTGLFRHVMIRKGFQTGEVMVVLVATSPILPGKNDFVKALRKEHPEITTIVLNVNPYDTGMVLGTDNRTLFGPGFILDRLAGLTFVISPTSFYQINPVMTENLYAAVKRLAALKGTETVLDAYSGIGTIGLSLASSAKAVIGVELNGDAVRDAVRNARQNRIGNARFYKGDATEFLGGLVRAKEHVDLIILDPPRSGSTEAFIRAAAEAAPDRVIYVSCGPESLSRDLELFEKVRYRVRSMEAYDMFPWTDHAEVVCLLDRA